MSQLTRKLPCLLAALYLVLFTLPLPAASPLEAQSEDAPQIEPKADEVLHRVAEFYRGQQHFSFELAFSTVVQAPGMKREMWVVYNVAAQRPNMIALRVKDGLGATVVSDGKTLSTFLGPLKKFTQREAPAEFEALFALDDVMLVSTGVGRLLFIDRLLKRDAYAGMIEGLSTIKYVGLEAMEDFKAHHLTLDQSGGMKVDLWIQDGERPFIRKASVDMSQPLAEVMPQVKETHMKMSATFSNWNARALAADTFVFMPPQDAKKVASLFDGEDDAQKQLMGKAAPNVELDLLGGGKFNLAEHKGKHIVVLEFWASWCAPCVQGMPIISGVASKFKNDGVVFYSINQNEEPEVIQAFIKKKNLPVPVALDNGGKAASAFGVTGIPLTVVIGRDGRIQAIHTGLARDLAKRLTEELETLVAGKQLVSFSF